jgi:hypothetical protein
MLAYTSFSFFFSNLTIKCIKIFDQSKKQKINEKLWPIKIEENLKTKL